MTDDVVLRLFSLLLFSKLNRLIRFLEVERDDLFTYLYFFFYKEERDNLITFILILYFRIEIKSN